MSMRHLAWTDLVLNLSTVDSVYIWWDPQGPPPQHCCHSPLCTGATEKGRHSMKDFSVLQSPLFQIKEMNQFRAPYPISNPEPTTGPWPSSDVQSIHPSKWQITTNIFLSVENNAHAGTSKQINRVLPPHISRSVVHLTLRVMIQNYYPREAFASLAWVAITLLAHDGKSTATHKRCSRALNLQRLRTELEWVGLFLKIRHENQGRKKGYFVRSVARSA